VVSLTAPVRHYADHRGGPADPRARPLGGDGRAGVVRRVGPTGL